MYYWLAIGALLVVAATVAVFYWAHHTNIRLLETCGYTHADAVRTIRHKGMPSLFVLRGKLQQQALVCKADAGTLAEKLRDKEPGLDVALIYEGAAMVVALVDASLNGGTRKSDETRLYEWQEAIRLWMERHLHLLRGDTDLANQLFRWSDRAASILNEADFVGTLLVRRGHVAKVVE